MADCIFCKILHGEAPSKTVYHDELVTAFDDIHPVAPIHILIITNQHIESVNELAEADEPLIGHLFTVAKNIAVQMKIDKSGYRCIINTGANSGQAVFHLHLHLIGGQRMRYPMG